MDMHNFFLTRILQILFSGMALCWIELSPAFGSAADENDGFLLSQHNPAISRKAEPHAQPYTLFKLNNRIIVKQESPLSNLRRLSLQVFPMHHPLNTDAILLAYQGKSVSVEDMNSIARAVQLTYQQAGYPFVRIVVPVQHEQGILSMKVYLGDVLSTQVVGDLGKSGALFHTYTQALDAKSPMTAADLENYLLSVNNIPGLDVKVAAEPKLYDAENASDTEKLLIRPRYDPIDGYVGLSNYGSKYVGPGLLEAGINWNQPTGPDKLFLQVLNSLPSIDELHYYSVGYFRILNSYSTEGSVIYSHADLRPGEFYRDLGAEGESDWVKLALTQPWVLRDDLTFSNTVTLAHLNSNNVYNALDFTSFHDKVTVLRLQAALGFRMGRSWTEAQLEESLGRPWMGAEENPATVSRVGATTNFSKVATDLSNKWYVGDRINMLTQFVAQYTKDPLVVSEQLAYGGPNIGKGYETGELNNDKGYIASERLQYEFPYSSETFQKIGPYVFYDITRMENNATLTQPASHESASSAGLGFELGLWQKTSTNFYVAKPLTYTSPTNQGKSWRFLLSWVTKF